MNPAAGVSLRIKTADLPSYITRKVCRDCNSRWMSRLEARVQPVLEPLMHARITTLGDDEQDVLAFWAVKTALVFQSMESELTKWARPADYEAMYALQGVPPGWQVWLGANSHGDVAWHRSHSIRRPESPADAVDGFGVMLSVGFAVLYIVNSFDPDLRIRLRREAAWTFKELCMGRPKGIYFPPPNVLHRTDLTGLPELLFADSVLLRTPA